MGSLSKFISVFMVLSLSGIPATAVAMVRGSDDGSASIQAPSDATLEDEIRALLRRARHPDAPGTPGGRPSRAEVTRLDRPMHERQALILAQLRQANTEVPVDEKLGIINDYFNLLASLITLRIAMELPHEGSWREGFRLEVPASIMRDFPSVGAPSESRLGDVYFPLTIDRGKKGTSPVVQLRISENLVQGLELGQLALNPSSEGYVTMIQYLAVRQLLQNLVHLKYLKTYRQVNLPSVPKELTEKLHSLGMSRKVLAEQEQAIIEPETRYALIDQFESIEKDLPRFVTREYVSKISEALGDPSLADLLYPVLLEGEEAQTAIGIDSEIQQSGTSLSGINQEQLVDSLKVYVSNAKGMSQFNKLTELLNDETLELDADQAQQVSDLIEARRLELLRKIPDSAITRWAASARRGLSDRMYRERRKRFLTQLIEASTQIDEDNPDHPLHTGKLNLMLLITALEGDLAELQPRKSTQNLIIEIAQQPDYISARDRYTELMEQLTEPEAITSGLVNSNSVQQYIESHDFTPEVEFSEKTNSELSEKLLKRVIEARKDDLKDFLAFGEMMGFHRTDLTGEPTIQQILTQRSHLNRYESAAAKRALNDFPVLSQEVTLKLSTGRNYTAPLYQWISLKTWNKPMGELLQIEARIREVEEVVDLALEQVEDQIRENIQFVAQAKDLVEIEKVLTSSLVLDLVMQGYPEFQLQKEKILEEILSPSLTNQLMRRYVGNYLAVGFGALMLLHGTKFLFKRTGPVVDAIMDGLAPHIQGYIMSAMGLIVVETGYEYYKLRQQRRSYLRTQDLAQGAAAGGALIDAFEMQGTKTAYVFAKWMFIARITLDGLFMYLPMMRPLLQYGKAGYRMAGDLVAFRKLGLKPGQWSALDDAFETAAIGAKSPKELNGMERAYVRLKARSASGQTWNLGLFKDIAVESPAEKALKEHIAKKRPRAKKRKRGSK